MIFDGIFMMDYEMVMIGLFIVFVMAVLMHHKWKKDRVLKKRGELSVN